MQPKQFRLILFKILLFGIGYFALLLLLVYVEKVESSSIHNLWDAFWYSIVTLTTVGYGDLYPVTVAGKILGIFFILGSITILSTVIGTISDNFNKRREEKKMGKLGTNFENHVVILGWNTFSNTIASELKLSKRKVVIITDEKNDVDLIYSQYDSKDVFVLFSDFNDIEHFKKANIEKSQLVFVNLESDMNKLVSILNIKRQHPNLKFMVSIDHIDLEETFVAAGVSYVLSKNTIASKLIASYIFEPEVAKFNIDILAFSEHEDDYDVQQFKVTNDNKFINKTYGELFDYIRSNTRSLPVAISKKVNSNYKLTKLPENHIVLEEGDYVIFINNGESMKFIKKLFNVEQGKI